MIHESWAKILKSEFEDEYFKDLMEFISFERKTKKVFPKEQDVFNAFRLPFDDVKAVILGQDPYHGEGQAHGLSFSVPTGVKPPPSLVNIYKELESDLGVKRPSHGCLDTWLERGVFLLNTTMTVLEGKPGSHQNRGWEVFTDAVIEKLSNKNEKTAFILWGSNAKKKAALINTNKNNLIIESAHPSPLSAHRGFFGSKPFSKTNNFLDKPIDWSL